MPSTVADAAVASVFAVAAVGESLATSLDDGTRAGPVWLNVTLGVLTCVPLAWRRRAPAGTYLVMLAFVIGPSFVAAHSFYVLGTLLPLCIAGYTVARASTGFVARYGWLPGALPPAVLQEPSVAEAASKVAFLLLFLGSAWATGRTLRRFDLQGAELRSTLLELAEEQAAREEEAIGQERRRIAAEMHDVVAHAVSTMVIQIGATRMDTADEQDRFRLRAAEETGRQALVELRRTLGLLTGGRASLAPLPGQETLPALIESFRSAGLDVRSEVALGELLPTGLGLTVYRVVQEGLTNALKHGRGAAVDLHLVAGDELVIRIGNDVGVGSLLLPPSGHGLAGMRERLALYGGTLSAQASGDRFELTAVVPLARLEAMA